MRGVVSLERSRQLPTGGNGSCLQLLRSRNFRLLWAAGTLSAIGDQFDLITFPWLVLLITGDPLAWARSSRWAVFRPSFSCSSVDRWWTAFRRT